MYSIMVPDDVQLERDNGRALFVRRTDGALLRTIDDPDHLIIAV